MSLSVRFVAIGACAVLVGLAGCGGAKARSAPQTIIDNHKPALLYRLPAAYSSPDGMTIGPDGSIYLSMNNAGAGFKFAHPAKIMRIAPDDKLYEFANLVPGTETKVASPLGLSFAQDGNLYVSDAQCFATKTPNSSRIQRVVVKDGKAVRTEVVAAANTWMSATPASTPRSRPCSAASTASGSMSWWPRSPCA